MITGRNGRIWAETVHDHESLAAGGVVLREDQSHYGWYGVQAGRIGQGEEPGPFGIPYPAATQYGAVLFRDSPATADVVVRVGHPAAAEDYALVLLGDPATAGHGAVLLLGGATAAEDRAGVLHGDSAAAEDRAGVLLGRAAAAQHRAGGLGYPAAAEHRAPRPVAGERKRTGVPLHLLPPRQANWGSPVRGWCLASPVRSAALARAGVADGPRGE